MMEQRQNAIARGDGEHKTSTSRFSRGAENRCFFFSSRRRHTRLQGDWSSDVCSSDLAREGLFNELRLGYLVVASRRLRAYSWRTVKRPPINVEEKIDRIVGRRTTTPDGDRKSVV